MKVGIGGENFLISRMHDDSVQDDRASRPQSIRKRPTSPRLVPQLGREREMGNAVIREREARGTRGRSATIGKISSLSLSASRESHHPPSHFPVLSLPTHIHVLSDLDAFPQKHVSSAAPSLDDNDDDDESVGDNDDGE